MWKELFAILSDNNPVEPMTQELMQMLELTKDMSDLVHAHVFDQKFQVDQRAAIYKLDVKVNKLERSIRKRVITHLSISHDHVSYCLLLMSLIKDAERVGDCIERCMQTIGMIQANANVTLVIECWFDDLWLIEYGRIAETVNH